MIGRMELRDTDPFWHEEVQVYPDVDNRQAVIKAIVGNITGVLYHALVVLTGHARGG